MLFDAIPFSEAPRGATKGGILGPFIETLERKLGVTVSYDARNAPFGRIDLLEQFALARSLIEAGIMESFRPISNLDDEPHLRTWVATFATKGESSAGGASIRSDADALTATLAEALERYLWRETTDYFRHPMRASTTQMRDRGKSFVHPDRFATYSREQRATRKDLAYTDETPFLWIEAASLVSGRSIFLPSQIVTGGPKPYGEPLIRNRNTNGLATWPTQAGARLRGALECIERDAYLIMWLNQLILPKLSESALRKQSESLSDLFETLERYRLKAHIIPLLTDAPVHAICAVIEDLSGHEPRFTLGLNAKRSLTATVEGALLESLRSRRRARSYLAKGPWDLSKKTKDVGHLDRAHYWAMREQSSKLEFMIAGEEREPEFEAWENDSDETHLARTTQWCRERGYELLCVSLTSSKKNTTRLHVEMAVIPELQPLHLHEKDFIHGGERWKEIPEHFGFKSRTAMFEDEPHPFS